MAAKKKLTTSQNFYHLKNLLFYDGHQPFYFYFNSLVNYKSDDPIYAARAASVAAEGTAALTQGFLDQSQANEKDSVALQQLQMALDTLKNAIDYERSNEIAYFKQKFALLKSTFDPEEVAQIAELRELERMFESLDNFDYNNFIVLVNSIMQGINNTKAVVEYEESRLEEVQHAMDKIRQVHENRLTGLSKKMGLYDKENDRHTAESLAFVEKNMNKFNRRIKMTYLEHGNLEGTHTRYYKGRKITAENISGVKKYLGSVRGTVEVEVAHWITNSVRNIADDANIMQQLQRFMMNWYSSHWGDSSADPSKAEKEIKTILIECFMDYGSKHIPQILSGAYDALSMEDITNILQDSLDSIFSYKITGLYDNIGQLGLTLDLFKNAQSIQDLEKNNGEQLYEALKRLRESIRRYRADSNKNPLTKEQRYFIKTFGTGNTQNDEYNEIMKLIDVLEIEQAKYEKALQRNKEVTDKFTTAANKHIKTKQGDEELVVTVIVENGEIKNLDEIKKAVASTKGANKFIRYASDLRASDLKGLITGLKTRVSHQLKKDIISAVERGSGSNGQKFGPIMKTLRDGLQNLQISIGGPTLSELRQTVLQNGVQDIVENNWTGRANRKNDVVTIAIKIDEDQVAKTIAKKVDDSAETIAETLSASTDDVQKEYIKEFSDYFYGKLTKLNDDATHDHNSYKKNAEIFFDYVKHQQENFDKVEGELTETAKLWQEHEQEMRAAGKSAEEIAKRRSEILGSLSDSFFVSSTMKTYNQYQNDIGFKGGSIGADLMEQLTNMNEIFTAAGLEIAPDDMDWLLGAIINCSPVSIVGERNKNIIENYLGSLAAFSLFDEGVAELEIIDALNNPAKSPINSAPNILHLYSVNGLYVPGSYVLQETYNQLQQCLTLGTMGLKLENKGARVEIHNTMSESGIPNRGKSYPTNRDPWGTIGDRALNSVSIKIVFLGGILDILNKMNNIMSNIQIPA